MILVNAIYFKGLWLHQFKSGNTKKKPFWITPNKSVDVPMMTITEKFRITSQEDLNATLLAIDYEVTITKNLKLCSFSLMNFLFCGQWIADRELKYQKNLK